MQSGLSFVVDQLACSSMDTACITIMHDQICQVSCKPHSFSATWLAFVMAFFSCLGLLDSVLPCFLSGTYTTLLSANSKALAATEAKQVVLPFPLACSFF